MAAGNLEANIAYNDIEFMKQIGRGAFGKVYKAKHQGKIVACKVLKYNLRAMFFGQHPQDIIQSYVRELKAYNNIRGVNVLKMIGHCRHATDTDQELIILTEYMAKGSLANVIRNELDLSYRRRLDLAVDVARGMSSIHDKGW
jgi:serine/threonine protein kinase